MCEGTFLDLSGNARVFTAEKNDVKFWARAIGDAFKCPSYRIQIMPRPKDDSSDASTESDSDDMSRADSPESETAEAMGAQPPLQGSLDFAAFDYHFVVLAGGDTKVELTLESKTSPCACACERWVHTTTYPFWNHIGGALFSGNILDCSV